MNLKYIKEYLSYDPITGLFIWLKQPARNVKIGSIAGNISKRNGYVRIGLKGEELQAHRLAFLFMEGSYPEEHTDHVNGIKCDNRWSNLRRATISQNRCNSSIPAHNTSGIKGLSYHKASNSWIGSITINRKLKRKSSVDRDVVIQWLKENYPIQHKEFCHSKSLPEIV
jgi:hypothetical protein